MNRAGWSALYAVGVLGLLAFMVVSTPFVLNELENRLILKSTANPEVKVVKTDVLKTGSNSFQLTITISAPASAYLVYTDSSKGQVRTILSVYGAQKENVHVFKIDNTSGGQATIMLNGVNSNPNGEPIQIR